MFEINDVIKVSKNPQDGINIGDIGTVVYIFNKNPPVYEIEFIDDNGRTLLTVPFKAEEITLHWSAKT